jgi:hypothetical protein
MARLSDILTLETIRLTLTVVSRCHAFGKAARLRAKRFGAAAPQPARDRRRATAGSLALATPDTPHQSPIPRS